MALIMLFTVVHAQRVSHDFRGQSLAEVLTQLNIESQQYRIHCILNQIDTCRVLARVDNLSVPDAVRAVTKGLPVKVKITGSNIFVQYKKKDEPTLVLQGSVFDSRTHKALHGASVKLLRADSTQIASCVVDGKYIENGSEVFLPTFYFDVPKKPQKLIIAVSHVGYKTYYYDYLLGNVNKRQRRVELPPFYMKEESRMLDEVKVVASKVMFYHRGDTIVYNADAFQLAEGSMLDALVRQLPGVELKEGGRIYHNGRFVENLLLNGKDFFKGSSNVLMENLPAYTVKEIKVYDRLGDMSRFLGKEMPGDVNYVMDVQLKRHYSIGWMANLQMGAATNSRYLAKLFATRFTDHSRIGAYGNANNLNDNRTPGETDDYSRAKIAAGLKAERKAGFTYNLEERDQQWRISGETEIAHGDCDLRTNTSQTFFLPEGNTMDRIQRASREKPASFSSYAFLALNLNRLRIELVPNIMYQRKENRADSWSATYQENVNTLSGESEVSVPLSGTLLNRRDQREKLSGSEFSTGATLRTILKLGPVGDALELEAVVKQTNDKEERYNLFAIGYGGGSTEGAGQLFVPETNTKEAHTQLLYLFPVSSGTTIGAFYAFKHTTQARNAPLYLLDTRMANLIEQKDYSFEQTVRMIDGANSFYSRSADNQHFMELWMHCDVAFMGGKVNANINLPLSLLNQRLNYRRGGIDTTIVRHSLMVQSCDGAVNYLSWRSNDNRRSVFLTYGLTCTAPPLLHMVNMRDATDPLNIQEGVSGLKNAYHHRLSVDFRKNNPEKLKVLQLYARYDCTQNELMQGCQQDLQTGARTLRMYNVNGNWNGNVGLGFTSSLNSKKTLTLKTNGSLTAGHSTNMIGTASAQRSSIRIFGISGKTGLSYKFGRHTLGLTGDVLLSHIGSKQEDFTPFNQSDITLGATALLHLPWKMELSTDFTAYIRRGYAFEELNTREMIWNVRLSRPLLKGRLLLMFDGFDLLGQLSNITRTINAQRRMETFTNTLPRYAMLHLFFRFSQHPVKH